MAMIASLLVLTLQVLEVLVVEIGHQTQSSMNLAWVADSKESKPALFQIPCMDDAGGLDVHV
jgi:hypothetical protein